MAKTKKTIAYPMTAVRPLPRYRYVLPQLIANITKQERYLPEINWQSQSFFYKLFRAYEWLFFRKHGISAEMSVSYSLDEETGKRIITYRLYTLEAALVHFEGMTKMYLKDMFARWRAWLRWFRDFELYLPDMPALFPQLAFEGAWMEPPQDGKQTGYVFAIATDASATGSFGASPDTWSHTTSGSDRILFVAEFNQSSSTSASYNSVAMTSLGGYSYSSPTGVGSLYMLVNPASGANTVSVSCGGNCIGISSSYSGAKQTDQPDASINTQTSGGSNAGSLTATVSVITANSWLVAGTICEGAALTAGTGATLRQTGANPAVALFDSNGGVSTGSQSMQVIESPSNKLAMGMVAFAPNATAVTVTPSAQVATFSISAYTVKYGRTITPSAQAATFSVPAYTISLPKVVAPNVQVATFSIPQYVIDAGGNITIAVNPQVATFSVPAYSILKDFTVAVNALTATFSTPTPTIALGTGKTVTPLAQALTFSVPSYTVTVEANRVVTPNVQVLTFSLPTLAKVGGVWRKIGRSTNATWTKALRNSN